MWFNFQIFLQSSLNMDPLSFRECYWSKLFYVVKLLQYIAYVNNERGYFCMCSLLVNINNQQCICWISHGQLTWITLLMCKYRVYTVAGDAWPLSDLVSPGIELVLWVIITNVLHWGDCYQSLQVEVGLITWSESRSSNYCGDAVTKENHEL